MNQFQNQWKSVLGLGRSWVPAIVWGGLIFVGSSLEPLGIPADPVLDFFVKKSLHFVEYFIFYVLVYRGLVGLRIRTPRIKNLSRGLISLGIVILYAVSDEWHQSFVPGREAKISDVMLDSAAASTAWLWLRHGMVGLPNKFKIRKT